MSIADKLSTIAENEQKVYDAGKKSEYDAFWDMYQMNGGRTYYACAFAGHGWTPETFKPKYDMIVDEAYMMFRCTEGLRGLDLVEHLSNIGVTLDFSKTRVYQYTFSICPVSRVGVLDMRNASQISGCFNGSAVKTIDKLIVNENVNFLNDVFQDTLYLENITIEGTLTLKNASSKINFQSCSKLTHDSIMSIINALADNSGDTSRIWEVTLGETNLAKLTDAEKNIAYDKGWLLN